MKELRWHEPASYRRAKYFEQERQDPFRSLRFAGFALLVILGIRFTAVTGPDSHPPGWPQSIALAVGLALVFAYGLPAMIAHLPASIVILSDKGVNNNVLTGLMWRIRFWAWDKISHYSMHPVAVGGHNFDIIALHGANDEMLVTLALPVGSARQQIEDNLRTRNLPELRTRRIV